MPRESYFFTTIPILLTSLMKPNALSADEGMWLFNNPPRKLLLDKYGFDPTASVA